MFEKNKTFWLHVRENLREASQRHRRLVAVKSRKLSFKSGSHLLISWFKSGPLVTLSLQLFWQVSHILAKRAAQTQSCHIFTGFEVDERFTATPLTPARTPGVHTLWRSSTHLSIFHRRLSRTAGHKGWWSPSQVSRGEVRQVASLSQCQRSKANLPALAPTRHLELPFSLTIATLETLSRRTGGKEDEKPPHCQATFHHWTCNLVALPLERTFFVHFCTASSFVRRNEDRK